MGSTKGRKLERHIKLRKRENTPPRPVDEPLPPCRLLAIAEQAARGARYYEMMGCEKLAEACWDFSRRALEKAGECEVHVTTGTAGATGSD